MTELSKYQIQSICFLNEKKLHEIDTIEILDEFCNIKTIDKAKNFLKEKFGIENEARNYLLEKDCWLNVKDHTNYLEIKVKKQKENIIYCYKK